MEFLQARILQWVTIPFLQRILLNPGIESESPVPFAFRQIPHHLSHQRSLYALFLSINHFLFQTFPSLSQEKNKTARLLKPIQFSLFSIILCRLGPNTSGIISNSVLFPRNILLPFTFYAPHSYLLKPSKGSTNASELLIL